MKVLLVGSKGSMGRRYEALLNNHAHIDIVKVDLDNFTDIDNMTFDNAIIATPTSTHYYYCKLLAPRCKQILCEKPVSKSLSEIAMLKELVKDSPCDIRMVCNWAYTDYDRMWTPENNRITYDYYNTGSDGFYWDLIQLVYLAQDNNFVLQNKSPFFQVYIQPLQKRDRMIITLNDVGWSYHRMLSAWLNTPEELWSLDDAYKATEKVINLIKGEV